MASLDISDPDITKYIKLVQDGSEANRWIVFSYVPRSNNKIKFCDSGSGDLKELREELDDSSIRFAYIRYTINNMKKFVYIPWCGDGVNGPIKGAFSGHAIEFSKMFKPIHHQVNARSEDDIDEKAITAALNKATGASYDSGSKVQGATKGTFIPSSVSQGREAATKSNAEVKNAINKNDYNKVQESSEYWKQNQAVKTEAPKPVRTEYNLSTERDDYWKQQQAEKQQQQQAAAQAKSTVPSRTVGNKFQQQTQQETVAPPPPRAAPSKGVLNRFPAANTTAAPEQPTRQAPPPARPSKPIYQEPEPVYEEQQQQHYEEPQQHYEEQQEYYEEQQPVEEQQYTEEQQYEQPAEDQQQYYQEEPQQQEYYEEQQPVEEQQQHYYEEQQPVEEQQQYEEQQYTEEQQQYDESSYASQVKALYDYTGENEGDLSFREGDIITILDQNDPDGWWQGSLPTGETGFFPSNHVCAI